MTQAQDPTHEPGRRARRAARGARRLRSPRVAVIGGGLSGVGTATKLRRAGLTDFVVFEKAESLGGTWRDNVYPGIACDIPSRYYTYRFALNPGWTSTHAGGAEILAYVRKVARDEGLLPHFRFGVEVTRAVWEDDGWTLSTAGGTTERFDFVVTSAGFLHHPRPIAIPGLETFAGRVLHTARWDPEVRYEGRRVGVIGNGSSGTQLIGEITKDVAHMTVFMRTPQWVVPMARKPYKMGWRLMQRWVPTLSRRTFDWYQAQRDASALALTEPGAQRAAFQQMARDYLASSVADPELREKLTPDYDPGCRRMVISSTFYDAVQSPHAEVVRSPIERVVPQGVVTSDGVLHELDVLVVATGFDAQAFLRHIDFRGRDGRTLDEAWSAGLRTYQSVALDGFPNLFMVGGPHSPFGSFSFILAGEHQSQYAVRWIEAWADGEFDAVEPTAEATERFTQSVRAKAKDTIWGSGCVSWYLDSAGVPSAWPFTSPHFRDVMGRREVQDFHLTRAGATAPLA